MSMETLMDRLIVLTSSLSVSSSRSALFLSTSVCIEAISLLYLSLLRSASLLSILSSSDLFCNVSIGVNTLCIIMFHVVLQHILILNCNLKCFFVSLRLASFWSVPVYETSYRLLCITCLSFSGPFFDRSS